LSNTLLNPRAKHGFVTSFKLKKECLLILAQSEVLIESTFLVLDKHT
jgi:hypothetical protein